MMPKLTENLEIVRFKIMINPLNRMAITDSAKKLNEKIKKGIKHKGEPLIGTIYRLISNTSETLSDEEKYKLMAHMYFEALDEAEELES